MNTFCRLTTAAALLLAVAVFTFGLALVVWFAIKLVTRGVRVSRDEEMQGLDLGEHGMEAYSGFQIFTNT